VRSAAGHIAALPCDAGRTSEQKSCRSEEKQSVCPPHPGRRFEIGISASVSTNSNEVLRVLHQAKYLFNELFGGGDILSSLGFKTL